MFLISRSLILFLCLACVKAFAFEFPSQITAPYTRAEIELNFFHAYNQELKELEKTFQKNSKESIYSKKNLPEISRRLQNKNRETLENIKSDTSEFLTREKAQAIFNLFKNHPIVSFQAAEGGSRYDPGFDSIGFCFGRAAYFHIELLRHKVSPKAIRKIFVIGQFLFEESAWNFHVITIVKGPGKTWWAIDPATSDHVEPLEKWSSNLTKLEYEPKTPLRRYYVTDPLKFQPDLGAYDPKILNLPIFHGFFSDLAKWFDTNPYTNP